MSKEDIINKYSSVIDKIDEVNIDMKKRWDIPTTLSHQTEMLVYAQTVAITELCKAICYDRIGELKNDGE